MAWMGFVENSIHPIEPDPNRRPTMKFQRSAQIGEQSQEIIPSNIRPVWLRTDCNKDSMMFFAHTYSTIY